MKRSMTLIETIIAMTLFSLLFTTLFFWYSTFSKKSIDPPHLQERYYIERLSSIFSNATLNSKRGVTAFYSSGDSLVFTFENGPCEEPSLSDVVLARLYIDHQAEALCLTIWPQPKEGKMLLAPSITFPLLDHVKDLTFSFYYPPNPFAGPILPNEIKSNFPREGWQPNWKPEYRCLPALVKLFTDDKKPPFIFDFPHPIIYASESA